MEVNPHEVHEEQHSEKMILQGGGLLLFISYHVLEELINLCWDKDVLHFSSTNHCKHFLNLCADGRCFLLRVATPPALTLCATNSSLTLVISFLASAFCVIAYKTSQRFQFIPEFIQQEQIDGI